jgi:hypothetical protein
MHKKNKVAPVIIIVQNLFITLFLTLFITLFAVQPPALAAGSMGPSDRAELESFMDNIIVVQWKSRV